MNSPDLVLTTERLTLRAWRDDDLPAFAALNADARVMRFLPRLLTQDESGAYAARIRQHFEEHGFGLWAVEVTDVTPFIGFVGLAVPGFESHFTPCVEVGWRLAHDSWGQGFATEAARAAVEYGFAVRELAEIVAITVPHNLPSRRVMEKLGMQRDPDDDFEHPVLPEAHPLRPHVLYRLRPEMCAESSDASDCP